MDVVARIKDLMEIHNWSVYELAKQADIDSSNASKMFQKNYVPTLPTIEKIAAAFHLTLSQFFAGEEEAYPLTPEQRAAVEAWNFLTPEQRALMVNVMHQMNRPPEK